MREFISVEEAEDVVRDRTRVVGTERVSLASAYGRTLAGQVVARGDIPPFDNSAMDGYAVRVADVGTVPVVLPVAYEQAAGTFSGRPVEPGYCVRIMTGAPLPPGADAVVPVEWTDGGNPVRIERVPVRGNAVRRSGEDVRDGQRVFEGGEIITPPVVGMLAALGYAEVNVGRCPTCAVITTGDELVEPHQTPGRGQIRNSNGPALAAQALAAGGSVSVFAHAKDNPISLAETLRTALDSDVIILSGGVSVGAHDYVKDVLGSLGVEILFWKVRQRPGKPLVFGTRGNCLVFGLPGNPVSSSICFDRYVRPSLARMLGRKVVSRPMRKAALTGNIVKVKGLRYFARGVLAAAGAGGLEVTPTGPQGSGIYSSMAFADCIIHLPEDMENPSSGSVVDVEPLTWF